MLYLKHRKNREAEGYPTWLPGKSSLNVRPVRSVRSVRPVRPVRTVCPV